MKKLFLALVLMTVISIVVVAPVFADDSNSASTSTRATSTPRVRKTVDLACMKSAVDKRDTAVIATVDTYATAAKAALQTRKTSLMAAWDITISKDRNATIRSTWKTYRDSIRAARKTFRDTRNAAWKQFSKDRKACSGSSEDASGRGYDESL